MLSQPRTGYSRPFVPSDKKEGYVSSMIDSIVVDHLENSACFFIKHSNSFYFSSSFSLFIEHHTRTKEFYNEDRTFSNWWADFLIERLIDILHNIRSMILFYMCRFIRYFVSFQDMYIWIKNKKKARYELALFSGDK